MYEKIIDWYLSREAVPYWSVLLTDCLFVLVAGFIAYAVNNEPIIFVANAGMLSVTLLAYMPCFLIGFRLFHSYSGIIRKSTFMDVARPAFALLAGVVLVMLLRFFLHADDVLLPMRFRNLLLQWLLATVMMCGLRVLAKVFYDIYLNKRSPNGAYGLDDASLLGMEMEELLPREPITVDMDAIRASMQGRSIMVTGAAGSIGSELARLLATFAPKRLVLIDQAESPLHEVRLWMKREHPDLECHTIVCNICHHHRMEALFKTFRPGLIFHAAAYKHVPMMEDNPVESVLNNVDGTCKLADLAVKYGVEKFVMISTDKAVNPTNVMGCSKRICEMYCQSLAKSAGCTCKFITTRFGNVLGSNGSVIPIFREQIRRGGPVMVTHPDIVRFFMLIPEACRLVLEAAMMGRGEEIFVFDMGKPVRIVDLAKRMIKLSGRQDIKIRFSGLRPGEKLYEEVLDDKETVIPTSHPKIKVARVREYDFETVRFMTQRLIETALTYDPVKTVRAMKRMVPEYKSENSMYCMLDMQGEEICKNQSQYIAI